MNDNIFLETRLYPPVKKLLTGAGYEVKSEIKSADVCAARGDQLVIIELKNKFCLKLVYQTLERLKITDAVYAAVPALAPEKDKNIKNLLKKIGVGLIYIENGAARVILEPAGTKNKKRAKVYLTEFYGRSSDANEGGTSRKKIITAYREKALKIAFILSKTGESSPAALKKRFGLEASKILRDNYYGWFVKIKRGVYNISVEGKQAMTDEKYKPLILYFENENIYEES
jgi:hypothetical protein